MKADIKIKWTSPWLCGRCGAELPDDEAAMKIHMDAHIVELAPNAPFEAKDGE